MLETLLPGVDKLDGLLLTLAKKGWLDNETDTAFKVSPVVQEITAQKNKQRLHKDCQNLIDRLIEKLLYEPGTGHFIHASYEAAALFARYGESIVHRNKETTDDIALLCERLGNYHRTTGNLDRALGFFNDYNRLENELYQAYPDNVDFKNGLALSYQWLGWTFENLETITKAKEYYQLSKELLTQLASSFPQTVEYKKNLDWVVSQLTEK